MSFSNPKKELNQPEDISTDEYQEEYGGLLYNHDLKEHEELIETPNIAQSMKLYKSQLQEIQALQDGIETKNNNAEAVESPQLPKNSAPETPQEDDSPLTRQVKQAQSREGTGDKYYGGSLGSLNGEPKKEMSFKDKSKLPTFGEDEFNMAVSKQISESPTSAKRKPSKIDKMLEEHKKRKALQKFLDMKNGQEISPILSEQGLISKDSNLITYETQQSQVLSIPTHSEGDYNNIDNSNGQKLTSGYNAAPVRYDVKKQSHYIREQYEGANNTAQATRGVIDQLPEVYSSVNSTGRFGGSQINVEFVECNLDSGCDNEGMSGSQIKNSSEEKPKSPSRKEMQRINDQKGKNTARIPKISENSQRIFENSHRAKEDEQIIQEILATKAKRLPSIDTKDANKLQKIPEENEENMDNQRRAKPTRSFSNSPKNKLECIPETALTKSSSNDPSPRTPERFATKSSFFEQKHQSPKASASEAKNKKTFERSNSSNSKAMSESQKSFAGKDSPKRSHLHRILKSYDMSESSNFASAFASPKSVKARTVVEHKKQPLFLSPNTQSSQTGTNNKTVNLSPNKKEIKEIATMTKQIYLKVVNSENIPESTEKSPETSPRINKDKNIVGQTKSPTSEFLRKLTSQKSDNLEKISVEELAKYDEIQRLEIMLQNLREIQKANLLSSMYSYTNGSQNEANSTMKQNRSYADTINEGAFERRTIRKQKEEERLAKLRKSPSPKKMEKIEMTLESLIQSIQLRQSLIQNSGQGEIDPFENLQPREDGPTSSWTDFNLYDRNAMWLLVRNEKLGRLNSELSHEEMKNCSFQPTFFTKRRSSDICSPNRSSVGMSPLTNKLSERGIIEQEENSEWTEKASYLKNKSLYKEKKTIDSYTEIFGLKKTYNVYKSDIFSPKRSEHAESRLIQQEEKSQVDANEGTIKRRYTTDE